MNAINNMLGKKVIVRTDRAGVFFGILTEKEGTVAALKDCRRLWRWSGAASISQLAVDGVKSPDDCKFTVTVDEIVVDGVIELIPCTEASVTSIEGVFVWKR